MTDQKKFPWLIVALVMAAIIGCLVWYIWTLKNEQGVKDLTHDKTEIIHHRDSLDAKRNDVIDTGVEKSHSRAAKAEALINRLNKRNEKIIIPDTTFTAMYLYITGYKANAVGPAGNR